LGWIKADRLATKSAASLSEPGVRTAYFIFNSHWGGFCIIPASGFSVIELF
jgi:hypothetical protein